MKYAIMSDAHANPVALKNGLALPDWLVGILLEASGKEKK